MTSQTEHPKVAELVKTADIYDLIKISMRSGDSKVSTVDRYIQRAVNRQTGAHVVRSDATSTPQKQSDVKEKHRRNPT